MIAAEGRLGGWALDACREPMAVVMERFWRPAMGRSERSATQGATRWMRAPAAGYTKCVRGKRR